jgi:hypothetical protein
MHTRTRTCTSPLQWWRTGGYNEWHTVKTPIALYVLMPSYCAVHETRETRNKGDQANSW